VRTKLSTVGGTKVSSTSEALYAKLEPDGEGATRNSLVSLPVKMYVYEHMVLSIVEKGNTRCAEAHRNRTGEGFGPPSASAPEQ
jgi:hypothetical protein